MASTSTCPRVQSPASKERNDEKNLLKNLNDRLACYIERALYLKNENSRLKFEGTQNTDNILCDQFRTIKDEFQRELDDLNDSAKKCAIDSEALKGDICSLKCHLESTRKQREKAENDAKALCKQLEKEKNDQRVEREELCKSNKVNDGQIQSELHIGYESKLQKLLNDLRNQFKDKMCIAGVDIIRQISNAHGQGGSKWGAAIEQDKLEWEATLECNISLVAELQRQLAECSSKKNSLRIQVDRYQREHGKNIAKIRRMQQELLALLNQYQDLIDIKLLLDFELAAYNQLLAIEEYRFNVSDMCQNTPPVATKRRVSTDECAAKRGR